MQERNILGHGLEGVCAHANGRKEHGVRPDVGATINENGILGLWIRFVDASKLLVHPFGQEEFKALVAVIGVVRFTDPNVNLGRVDVVCVCNLKRTSANQLDIGQGHSHVRMQASELRIYT